MRQKVIILIGIPASGKSSLARQLSHQGAANLISTDLIRAEIFGCASIQGNWSEILTQIKLRFEQSFIDQKTVIYDATNCQPLHRQEIMALSKTVGYETIWGIWLNMPLWICLERNSRRPHPVPESAIIEMHKSLLRQAPSLDEGFEQLMIKNEAEFDDSLL